LRQRAGGSMDRQSGPIPRGAGKPNFSGVWVARPPRARRRRTAATTCGASRSS